MGKCEHTNETFHSHTVTSEKAIRSIKQAFQFSEKSSNLPVKLGPKHMYGTMVLFTHKTPFMIIAYTALTVDLAPKIN